MSFRMFGVIWLAIGVASSPAVAATTLGVSTFTYFDTGIDGAINAQGSGGAAASASKRPASRCCGAASEAIAELRFTAPSVASVSEAVLVYSVNGAFTVPDVAAEIRVQGVDYGDLTGANAGFGDPSVELFEYDGFTAPLRSSEFEERRLDITDLVNFALDPANGTSNAIAVRFRVAMALSEVGEGAGANFRPVIGESFYVEGPAPRVSEVPLPAAGWMLLAGLGGLAGLSGRRR